MNENEISILDLVRADGRNIRFIKNPSLDIQLEAVKQDDSAIQFIENPCLEVQLEAVKQDGYTIKLIDSPYLEVQLAAVRQNGDVVKCIKDPCLEIQIEAVKQSSSAIHTISDPCLEVQLAAVRKWGGHAAFWIKNPDVEVCVIAYSDLAEVLKDPKMVCSNNPSLEIKCGSRYEELRGKFPHIRHVFIK